MIHYFGAYCHGKYDKARSGFVNRRRIYVSWCDETGQFFTGMSQIMTFPSFNIKLNSPTSTSRHLEVALHFSDEDGVVVRFNNNGLQNNDRTACFDASWISCYKEEDEMYVVILFQ